MKFKYLLYFLGSVAILFVFLPLLNIITKPSLKELIATLNDKEVLNSLFLSLYASVTASIIAILIGTPLAYIFARKNFPFKKILEGIIDLPIMIPHPVIGIAIISVVAKDYWIGKILSKYAIDILGNVQGIIIVLTYVGLPFYINSAKAGFKSVPERLEYVSRSLGKSFFVTFFRITLPLSYRSLTEGLIMSTARAISEFGAVIVIAYHPMVAPVLIYERFNAYGLKYSIPVAVILISISLILFVFLRFFSTKKDYYLS